MLNYFKLAFILSVIIYSRVYIYLRKKFFRISLGKIISQFIFIGYFIMLILVTQVMGYDSDRVSQSNIIPFNDIICNIIYIGSFRGVGQFLLNMIMFIPIGSLFPIVFSKKKWDLKSIFFTAFSITFIVELIQFIIGRGADIDDIIANTLGGGAWDISYM